MPQASTRAASTSAGTTLLDVRRAAKRGGPRTIADEPDQRRTDAEPASRSSIANTATADARMLTGVQVLDQAYSQAVGRIMAPKQAGGASRAPLPQAARCC